jgi:hypothetical protein
MLWFDNDPRTTLTVKVTRAADYYRQKYGLVPDLCLVHPSMLSGPNANQIEGPVLSEVEGPVGKVAVRSNRLIQPGHLWIGKEEKN